jgi:hypothetical protein
LVPNTISGPANNTEVEAHLTGKFSLEQQTLNTESFLIYRAGARKTSSQNRRAKFRGKVKFNKE